MATTLAAVRCMAALMTMFACVTAQNRTTLHFVFMISGLDSSGEVVEQNTAGVLPAVEMAIQQINDNPFLLPGYRLNYSAVLETNVSH